MEPLESIQVRALLDRNLRKGRLTPAEHERRWARAQLASGRAQLVPLLGDLPGRHPYRKPVPLSSLPWSMITARVVVRTILVLAICPGFIVPIGLSIEHHLRWIIPVYTGGLVVLGLLDEALDALASRRRG